MAYVPVPKDLTKVKTKVMFNLTKRQLVCFGSGALIGVPLFFLLREPAGSSVAAMCMMLVMGVKKLPTVKSLQTEYAKVLEEKKKAYAEYRRSREEMRELLTAKANVDRLLNMEAEHDTEKEKDHAQR